MLNINILATDENMAIVLRDSYEVPNNVLNAIPEPIVSVVIITFQHKAFIEQCIESVLMQKTNFPFEIIIGEDCSSDGTREIVFEYTKKYPYLIRVITADYNMHHLPGNGRRTRAASRGKYIALCEGDDYWTDPLKLQKQVDLLEGNSDSVAVCGSVNYLYEGKSHLNFNYLLKKRAGRNYFLVDEVIYHGGGLIPTCSLIFRTEILNNLPKWFNASPVGDYPLNILLALSGKIYFTEEVVATYRALSLNSWTNTNRSLNKILSANNKLIKFLGLLNKETGKKYNKIISKKQHRIIYGMCLETIRWVPYQLFRFFKKNFKSSSSR